MSEIKLQKKIRIALKFYSFTIIMIVITAVMLMVVSGQFKVESQDLSCTGNFGSGAECNRLGAPDAYRTWSCVPNNPSNLSDGYHCAQENAATCTYDIAWGVRVDCGCAAVMPLCEQRCRDHYQNSPSGTYTYSDPEINCVNCGQRTACSCTIVNNPTPTPTQPNNPTATPTITPTIPTNQCPYSQGQVQALFFDERDNGWKNGNEIPLVCGDSIDIGALNTSTGQLMGNDGVLFVNGQQQNNNISTYQTGANTETININIRVRNNSGGFYPEAACNSTNTITCTPQVINNICPYQRLGIQMSTNGNTWSQSVTPQCGDPVFVRLWDTQANSSIGSNGRLFINNNQASSNSISFQTQEEIGTYLIRGDVLDPQGNIYPETNCYAFASVSCEPEDNNNVPNSCNDTCNNSCENGLICHNGRCRDQRWPEEPNCTMTYDIDKDIVSGNNAPIFSEVSYRVIMTNQSTNTTYNTVPYRDTYNRSQLIFRNPVLGTRLRADGFVLQSASFNLGGTAGNLTYNDLTVPLGDLGPGERYVLTLRFQATASGGSICNTAGWNPDQFGWMDDNACIGIRINIPDTDL